MLSITLVLPRLKILCNSASIGFARVSGEGHSGKISTAVALVSPVVEKPRAGDSIHFGSEERIKVVLSALSELIKQSIPRFAFAKSCGS